MSGNRQLVPLFRPFPVSWGLGLALTAYSQGGSGARAVEARVTGAAASATAGQPFTPPTRDPGLGKARPAAAGGLAGDELGEPALIQLGVDEVVPGAGASAACVAPTCPNLRRHGTGWLLPVWGLASHPTLGWKQPCRQLCARSGCSPSTRPINPIFLKSVP